MRIRPYAAEDAAGVVEFFRAACAVDRTLKPVSPAGWRDYVAESWIDGGRDFVVAEDDDGRLCGLLVSARIDADERVRHFRIVVDPAARRRGLATRLLRELERQDPTGSVVEQANCEAGWTAGATFLERSGFACEAASLDMQRDGEPPDAAPAPEGVRLRPDDGSPRDSDAWIALSEAGYRGTPGYSPMSAGDVARKRAEPGSHMWVAEDAVGAVIGHCRTVLWQGEEPWIDSVVVAAAWRGKGLGRALTAAGVRTLADAGHATVRLNVRADNAPARRIYEALGFRITGEVRTFRRRRAPR